MEQRIIMAAAAEMNERGVKFTLDAVASRLGISKKTIYRYFAGKDGLITAVVGSALADVEAQRTAIMNGEGGFVERLSAILTVEPRIFGKINDWVFDDIRRCCPSEWAEISRFRRRMIATIADMLEEGIAEGCLRPVHPQVAAQILFGAGTEFFNYEFLKENNLTFGDALHSLTDIFLCGVLPRGQEGAKTDERCGENK